jgi:hypothetical protein
VVEGMDEELDKYRKSKSDTEFQDVILLNEMPIIKSYSE